MGVYSTAKPFAALGLLVLVDRGLVELDAPVVRYWLRYGDRGKAATTVRHVFTHRAGLMATDPPIPAAELFDWNRVCEALAASPPQWEPGTDQGEHAVFYGHLVGEIARRVTGVPFGAWLRREIAAPWGLELHSGLTPDEMSRCATLVGPPDPGVANGPGWRGGSLGWADPRAGIAFAYVTAGMRTHERAMAVWEAARRT